MMFAAMAWPTWQEAWATSVVLIVLYAVTGRLRSTPLIDAARPAIHELIVLTGLYGLWRTAKKLPLEQSEGAIERARDIVDLQGWLRLPSELGVQEFVLRWDWLGWLNAAYYAAMHVPSIFAFLIWMFWRHRDEYGRWRNALALTTAGCLFIRFWRVAPPRFLTDLGFQDLSEVYGMSVYGSVGSGVSGQFAAMPSIHVAWAAVIAFGIIAASPSRWKWLFAAHLPLTIIVVTSTGHHWWLDGIVALGLLLIAIAIDRTARLLLDRSQLLPTNQSSEQGEPLVGQHA